MLMPQASSWLKSRRLMSPAGTGAMQSQSHQTANDSPRTLREACHASDAAAEPGLQNALSRSITQ